MRYDSNSYTAETFFPKFEKLLDNRYGHLKKHKRRNAFIKEYDKKYNDTENGKLITIENTVKQWGAYKQKPSLEKLMNICEMLDCDIDYFLTSQESFKKEIFSASETTGLNYKTIEILETIKTSPKMDSEKYIHKCILFVLDFLLQRTSGRYIFFNLFHYLFKEYNFVREHNGGSNSIEFEADSIVSERNVALFVDDVSEGIFFSNITTGIANIKVKENTTKFDTSNCDYLPTKEEIQKKIENIDKRIKSMQKHSYKKRNPYTPKYALEYQHHEDTGEWESRDTLAECVTNRANFDYYINNEIERLKQEKEKHLLKYKTLYP